MSDFSFLFCMITDKVKPWLFLLIMIGYKLKWLEKSTVPIKDPKNMWNVSSEINKQKIYPFTLLAKSTEVLKIFLFLDVISISFLWTAVFYWLNQRSVICQQVSQRGGSSSIPTISGLSGQTADLFEQHSQPDGRIQPGWRHHWKQDESLSCELWRSGITRHISLV